MAGRMAELLGKALRLLIVGTWAAAKAAPGIAGACAVIWGVASINVAAGWIVAGAFLLLVDRRVK